MTHVDGASLASFYFFSPFDEQERAAIAAMAVLEAHPAGTALFTEHEPSTDVYFVLEGRVMLCTKVPGRAEACFLTLRSGELLGWSALLRRPRVATARVVARSSLLRIPASPLLEFCERNHDVGYAVMKQAFEALADRLQDTRLQLLDVFGTPREAVQEPR